MKNKGFTLVEMLAVIVILAIIALITVPTTLNVISNSRLEGAKSKAFGTISAVKNTYAQFRLFGVDVYGNGVTATSDSITVTFSDGNESFGDKIIAITGERPTSGSVTIDKKTGLVTCNNLLFKSGGKYYCSTTDGKNMECSLKA